jgi:hypothetical protein
MKRSTLSVWIICLSFFANGQQLKTRNLIFITLDGFRWQEVFHGADPSLLENDRFCKSDSLRHRYSAKSESARRKQLMPFFWEEISRNGQLYGNRDHHNEVNCANHHWFSYPGYSEILTGLIERKVRSNKNVANPNATFLEFLNCQPEFNWDVAAFATWETFNYILREEISNIPVNAGKDQINHATRYTKTYHSETDEGPAKPTVKRCDAVTFQYALEYLRENKPRVLFLGLDETDEYGHKGRYDEYLEAAHRADQMIARLWEWVQTQPDYKDQTTFIITTDHGRGKGTGQNWKRHGRHILGSNQVWFAVLGPDTPPLGEVKTDQRYYLKQLAKTAVSFLGYTYTNVRPVGESIKTTIVIPDDAFALRKNSR